MDCPICTQPARAYRLHRGGYEHYCEGCGWGKEEYEQRRGLRDPKDAEPAAGPRSAGRVLLLMVLWTLSVLAVFGPYYALLHGHPETLARAIHGPGEIDPAVMAVKLHPRYWIAIVTYIMLAYLISPTRAIDESRWNFLIDARWNTWMILLAILLLPGKAVWFTLEESWLLLRGLPREEST